jgi:hypothetical protein
MECRSFAKSEKNAQGIENKGAYFVLLAQEARKSEE